MRTPTPVRAAHCAGLLTLLALGACTATTPRPDAAASSDMFGAEAEQVFRRQNRVFDELIVQSQAAAGGNDPYAAAERRLSNVCRYINAAANAMQAGQSVPLKLKLEAMNSLKDCDNAARDVWQLLGHDRNEDPLSIEEY
ncbi:MAG: hypothetical protein HY943_05780 [Gammaproteobacteria bacterium]|nr:hypothetical protein [Gammaproteobacteria bacterium]